VSCELRLRAKNRRELQLGVAGIVAAHRVLVVHATSIAAVLAVGAASAHAEHRIAARAGVAGTVDLEKDTYDSTTRIGPGFHVDAGVRLVDTIAVGLHVGLTRNKDTEEEFRPPDDDLTWHNTYTAVQIGIGVQYSIERIWLAPWIGIDERTRDDGSIVESERRYALGLTVGADLYVHPSGHRVGLYGELSGGRRTEDGAYNSSYQTRDIYLSIGVAYRYW
jgi:hypothetical protein